MELDYLTFCRLYRDALCLSLQETEGGRKYLEDAYRLTQTEPDIESLRNQFSK